MDDGGERDNSKEEEDFKFWGKGGLIGKCNR